MKTCTGPCGERKPDTAFPWTDGTHQYRRGVCGNCYRAMKAARKRSPLRRFVEIYRALAT